MIIFLYGPDTFRSKEKLKMFKEKFVREVDKSGLNLIDLDAEKMTITDLNKAVATQSFLAKKRMAVLRNIFKQRKALQTEVLELLKASKYREGKDDNILIFWDEEPDKRSALFKYLAGSKFKEGFEILKNSELSGWIVKTTMARGGRISKANADFLASKSGGDLWALSGEIDKLLAVNFGQEISKESLEQSTLVKIEDNIFNLTDAIGNRNTRLALKLLHDNLEAGANGIYLLTMIVRQFRILVQVKAALAEGPANTAGGQDNYRGIATGLGLHPFVVQKAMAQAMKYSMEQLRTIYKKLLEIDLKLKSGGDGETLLEMFAVEVGGEQ
ncbi:MAG: polymerase III, delta subunit protein [Candidatus Kuenenbacteria bacterium GW2011_GWA2_42_15]|nr:MAG: polymerase III, delta subunit protein [Candidatus Kuenenbacteria bacterium GW2011_GWA2_42_15]